MPMQSTLQHALEPSFSSDEFRQALAMFATGVTIVTATKADGTLVGLTASSFNSVSLSPPLVLWSLAQNAGSMAAFSAGSHYAVNILSASQQDLARQFAMKNIDKFQGVQYHLGESGAPVLDGAVATFECFNRSQYQEGDHVIFVGEVERCNHRPGASPLLFHGGKFYAEHPL
ncbi:MAG: flavin reductase [Burkholderiales bacterium PBB4]|nr:MAG: flavin reductase [Burkholderiales bacterium PBB4]